MPTMVQCNTVRFNTLQCSAKHTCTLNIIMMTLFRRVSDKWWRALGTLGSPNLDEFPEKLRTAGAGDDDRGGNTDKVSQPYGILLNSNSFFGLPEAKIDLENSLSSIYIDINPYLKNSSNNDLIWRSVKMKTWAGRKVWALKFSWHDTNCKLRSQNDTSCKLRNQKPVFTIVNSGTIAWMKTWWRPSIG